MRVVVRTATGVLEMNYMWMPTWIGMNGILKRDIEKALAPDIEGRELCDALLDEVHDKIVNYICEKNPSIQGLDRYLDAIKSIDVDG